MVIASNLIGFIASSLVLMTFLMKDMRRLRFIAILSNIAFIAYGALAWLLPVLCLHLVLLPLNVLRLWEITKSPVLMPPMLMTVGRKVQACLRRSVARITPPSENRFRDW